MTTALQPAVVGPLGRHVRACFPSAIADDERAVAERLREVTQAGLVEAWLRADAPPECDDSVAEQPDSWFETRQRRAQGIYLTPEPIAGAMAAATTGAQGETQGELIVDPAAGDGRLLAAVLRRRPEARVVAVERQPELALAAAARIAGLRAKLGDGPAAPDRVVAGDGLEAQPTWFREAGAPDAVVMNPPYVGEKNNRAFFESLEEAHPDLGERMRARGDLAYLFLQRALDWLEPGGRLVALTSSYWLSATGGRRLREELRERSAPRLLVRAPTLRLFDDAPGHHSMLSVFRRKASRAGVSEQTEATAVTVREEPGDWERLIDDVRAGRERPALEVCSAGAEAFLDRRWTPFAGVRRQRWGKRRRQAGTRLEALLEDRQGFVSGADRLSTRRYNTLTDPPEGLEVGDPLFLWHRDELDARLKALRGTVLRPVLRGSDLEAGRVVVEPPQEWWVLYLDDVLDDAQLGVVEHLEPVRAALAARREVRRGRMPWYRLHWPRCRAEQTMPKLVVPRRAAEPTFALDLAASAVSSDCTYLVPPEDVDAPVDYLVRLLVALNRAETGQYLRHFGKTKGEQIEFYSDPLRALPLPLRREGGGLAWEEAWVSGAEIEELEAREASLREAFAGPSGG